jgi:hypothetical protein
MSRHHPDGRRVLTAGALLTALVVVAPPADAAPRWSIARPITKGEPTPLAAAPLRKEAAAEQQLAERYPVTFERIDVEGRRDESTRRGPPGTPEQRFAAALNEGSPELIAGHTYNGYYYDGTLFWGADPLSFAWKNVTHWLKR